MLSVETTEHFPCNGWERSRGPRDTSASAASRRSSTPPGSACDPTLKLTAHPPRLLAVAVRR